MKKAITFALISLLFLATSQAPAAAEPENYCDNKESWTEWADLVAKYPNNKDVQALHALSKSAVSRATEKDRRAWWSINC